MDIINFVLWLVLFITVFIPILILWIAVSSEGEKYDGTSAEEISSVVDYYDTIFK